MFCQISFSPYTHKYLTITNIFIYYYYFFIFQIQNVSNRPERVFIESRQLKICATCFDLALALLRVLEMVASISRPIFTEKNRPSSELLLSRLCQVIARNVILIILHHFSNTYNNRLSFLLVIVSSVKSSEFPIWLLPTCRSSRNSRSRNCRSLSYFDRSHRDTYCPSRIRNRSL